MASNSLSGSCAAVRRSLLTAVANSSNASVGKSSTPDTPLMIIGGVDSQAHPLHESVVKYLALGAHDVHEPTLQPAVAALDDSVLLLQRRQATVINSLVDGTDSTHLHGLSNLRGAEYHTVSAKERDDDGEVSELYKVLSFVDAAQRFASSSIAVPLTTTGGPKAGSASAVPWTTALTAAAGQVETWPLVQAYALQDVGPGGFFSMKHKVVDVGDALVQVIGHVDAHALKRLLRQGRSTLARQWRAFESAPTHVRNFSRRGNVLTVESVAEPLASYFEFAAMQGSGNSANNYNNGGGLAAGSHPMLRRQASLLVGRFTSAAYTTGGAASSIDASWRMSICGYEAACSGNVYGSGIGADIAEQQGAPTAMALLPVHAIAEVDDPSTGLRACRTLLLRGNRAVIGQHTCSTEAAAAPSTTASLQQELLSTACADALLQVYALLTTGVATGIHTAAGPAHALMQQHSHSQRPVSDADVTQCIQGIVTKALLATLADSATGTGITTTVTTVSPSDQAGATTTVTVTLSLPLAPVTLTVGVDAMDASGSSVSSSCTSTSAISSGDGSRPDVASSSAGTNSLLLPFAPRRIYYVKAALTGIVVNCNITSTDNSNNCTGASVDTTTACTIPLGSVAFGDTIVIVDRQGAYVAPSPFLVLPTAPGTHAGTGITSSTTIGDSDWVSTASGGAIVRNLTAAVVPLTHAWCIGGNDSNGNAGGEAVCAHALATAVLTASNTSAGAGASGFGNQQSTNAGEGKSAGEDATPGGDCSAFEVGDHGGGVGTQRRKMTTAPSSTSSSSALGAASAFDQAVVPSAITTPQLLVASLGRLQSSSASSLSSSSGGSPGIYHGATILTGGSLRPSITGTLRLYERGFVLMSPDVGPVVIHMGIHVLGAEEEQEGEGRSGAGADGVFGRRRGLHLVLGSDIIAAPSNTTSVDSTTTVTTSSSPLVSSLSLSSAPVKASMAGWVEAGADTVLRLARDMVAMADGSRTASGAGATSISSQLTSADLPSPPDVLLLRLKPSSLLSPVCAFAGCVSSSSTLASQQWIGLILPQGNTSSSNGNNGISGSNAGATAGAAATSISNASASASSGMRSAVIDALSSWRAAVPGGSGEAGSAPSSSSSPSPLAHPSRETIAAVAAGRLPAPFLPGYLSHCPSVKAIQRAWGDCAAVECCLHADADAASGTPMAASSGGPVIATTTLASSSSSASSAATPSSTPIYIISGVAGAGAPAFAHTWADTVPNLVVVDCNAAPAAAHTSPPTATSSSTAIDCSSGVDAATLASLLLNARIDAASRRPSTAGSSNSSSISIAGILLVAPHHADPAAIAAAVQAVNASGGNSGGLSVHVAGVVTVVHVKHLFADARRTHYLPGLQLQLSPGWCQAVVIAGAAVNDEGAHKDADAERVMSLVRSLYSAGNGTASSPAALPSIIRVAGGPVSPSFSLSSSVSFSLPYGVAARLVSDLPSSWAHPRQVAHRHISVPGWREWFGSGMPDHHHGTTATPLSISSSSSSSSPSGPTSVLHVYAPDQQSTGATLGDHTTATSGESSPSFLRVLSFLALPSASTTTMFLPPAVEERSLHALLTRLVVLGVDRAAAVCVAAAEREVATFAAPGDQLLPYQPPGLRVSVPADGYGGNNDSDHSSSSSKGHAYITAWHVTGYVRLTAPMEQGIGLGHGPVHARVAGGSGGEHSLSPASSVTSSASSSADGGHWARIEATPYAIRITAATSPATSVCATIASAGGPAVPPLPFLQLTGLGMGLPAVQEGLKNALLACRPSLPAPITPIPLPSLLSPSQLASIVRQHATDCLPQGCTYDGSGSYFDMQGQQLAGHPARHAFAARHVAYHNACVGVWNRLVAACRVAAAAEAGEVVHEATSPSSSPAGTGAVITWPTAKDLVDVDSCNEAQSLPVTIRLDNDTDGDTAMVIDKLPGQGLSLPQSPASASSLSSASASSSAAPWWEQVAAAKAWLDGVALTTSTLRVVTH